MRCPFWLGWNGERLRESGATCDAAVDWNVSVACVVPLVESVKGDRVQDIFSEARVPQVGEKTVPEPARPFWLVKVRVVEAD